MTYSTHIIKGVVGGGGGGGLLRGIFKNYSFINSHTGIAHTIMKLINKMEKRNLLLSVHGLNLMINEVIFICTIPQTG